MSMIDAYMMLLRRNAADAPKAEETGWIAKFIHGTKENGGAVTVECQNCGWCHIVHKPDDVALLKRGKLRCDSCGARFSHRVRKENVDA